jgi:hypothetical protein
LIVAYFLALTGTLGTVYWILTFVKRLSQSSDRNVISLLLVPAVIGVVGMLVNGWHSDKTGERRWHAAIPLLAGLERNPAAANAGADLHAYDLFQWADWMKPWQLSNADGPLQPGDTFLPEFVRQVGPYDHHKRLLIHAGDLARLGWCGRPIELLVVDVMKYWDLANCVVHDFFPCLIPGRSYVFHQDFCHYYTSWIHLIHYRLRDHFEKVASLPESGTVVFKYTSAFPLESLRRTYSFADFSDAEVEAAFEFSLSQVDADQLARRQAVMAAKVMVSVHKSDPERARRELAALAAQGWAIEGELKTVQDEVNLLLNKGR